jgi:hypothetical protein
MSLQNLSTSNAKTLWAWAGEKELKEYKEAIIKDRKLLQKWANRAASKKLDINHLKQMQLTLRNLINNEEHLQKVKSIQKRATTHQS